jgi:rRNA-processing protein FCF1
MKEQTDEYMKYVVDTSLINILVDGTVAINDLPSDGPFLASHIQHDELSATTNLDRKGQLLAKFTEIIDEITPTETFVLDTSQLDAVKLGDGLAYNAMKKDLDDLNNKKKNNSRDALIAEVALRNGYTLLVADYHMYKVAEKHGITVIHWKTSPSFDGSKKH